jgi:putative transposase
LVWRPKYRKWIKREDIRKNPEEIFWEVAEHYGFEIQEVRVAPDHVYIFLSFLPRYLLAQAVAIWAFGILIGCSPFVNYVVENKKASDGRA